MRIKMKIGIDIDEVLADFMPVFLDFYNQEYKTSFTCDDFKNYDLWKTFGGTKEQTTERLHQFFAQKANLQKIKPVYGSQIHLAQLKQKAHLVLITARWEEITKPTLEWVNKYFPATFSDVYFTNAFSKIESQSKKSNVCLENNIDILVEDNLEYADDCASQGVKVFLFDKPWNQCKSLSRGITRVKSWKELIKKI